MRRIWILVMLIAITHCGTKDSSIIPPEIGAPSDNNAPVESSNPTGPIVTNDNSGNSSVIFNVPIVALRGVVPQVNTSQATIP